MFDSLVLALKGITGPGTNTPYHVVKDDELAIEQEYGEMLMKAVARSRPRTIVEVGTGTGYSTSWLLLGTIAAKKGRIISYDNVQRPAYYLRFGLPIVNLDLRRGEFPHVDDLPESIDFLFHDSQHRYELIEPDLELVLPRMTARSQIWIHDVRGELNRLMKDFFESRGWEYEHHAEACGMAVARKGAKT